MTTDYTVPFTSLLASDSARGRLSAHVGSGGCFAYPTATVYGLGSDVSEESVRSLAELKRRPSSKPFLIVSGRPETFAGLEWTPQARQLAERFWPGRMTLILNDPDGVFPSGLQGSGGGVAVRLSAHPVVRAVEWAVGSPVTSTSANAPGQPPALDAQGAVAAFRALQAPEAWVVDGGRIRPSASSTIVDCTVEHPRVVREGTFSLQEIESAVSGEPADPNIDTPKPFSILFVCTGNTCRSPLAEVIANRRLIERGWVANAASAGVFAAPGSPASQESEAVARHHGLNLEAHAARQLDEEMATDADLILTMGPGHLDSVRSMGASGKSALLSAFAEGAADPYDGASVIDPFGQSRETYEATYDALVTMIDRMLERLVPVLAPRSEADG